MKGTVKKSGIYFDNYPKKGSNNAVTSDGIARAIESGGGGGGGTGDYNDLTNKPKINGTTLQGNKTLSALGIASSEDLTALVGRVTQAESDIDTLETSVAGKADSSDVTALAGRVTQAESDIDTLETTVEEVNKQIKNIDVSSQTIQKNSERVGRTKLTSVTVPKNSVVTITVSYWNTMFVIERFVILEENIAEPYPVFVKPVLSNAPQDGLTVTLCNTSNVDKSFGVFFDCEIQTNDNCPFYLMISTMLLN